MQTRNIVCSVVMLMLPLLGGCVKPQAAPAAQHTYRLQRRVPMLNTWGTTVSVSIEGTHRAVLAGFKDLGLQPITNRVDRIAGVVDAVFADGVDVEIKLEAVSANATRISIRCGLTGDQPRTEMVFRAIERRF